jgi:hypothetical protein
LGHVRLPDDFDMQRDLDPRHFGMWRRLVMLPDWLVAQGFMKLPGPPNYDHHPHAAAAVAYEAGAVAPPELQPHLLALTAVHYYHWIHEFAEEHLQTWGRHPEELHARWKRVREQLSGTAGPEQDQIWVDALPDLASIARELRAIQSSLRATPFGGVGE